ncbi:Uu.00g122220.m01.CDS01 [Anthostomella pinea]|uniref:Uu.00g122220.m01.CDS01 n=1 Tax=Anthostomella pinea TaxID=933095 RepID=A0AAI8YEZ3_9PEZI|nr:Uu.00g122220.m01.CDS01 [Anthostomella pinea]
MTSISQDQDPGTLVKALLTTIEEQIIPLTGEGVSSGSKVFGAAILSKYSLTPLTVATNNEAVSPLLHGEINCIQKFFAQTSFPSSSSSATPTATTPSGPDSTPTSQRPNTKDCIFLATHEPCSLCLSGITWSGFDNFFYLFTYADSRDLFAIPYDIQILEEVFRVPLPLPQKSEEARELYNRRNKFFTARSVAELVDEIADAGERERWRKEVQRVRALYGRLSETYQEGKMEGVESASFWK